MIAPITEIKYSLGTFNTTHAMRTLIDKVLDSGRLSYGPLCREFETRFANMHSCAYGILSNSGTSSLQVTLQALKEIHGWKDGDEVLVPSITFVATINVVYHCNLKPILVDVDSYFAMNPILIERAITSRTRCVMPIHPFGQPADMKSIKEIADKYGLKIIEDSCEAMFVRHEGKSVGAWGDAACFSTYVAHLITGGVGGVTTTGDPDLALHIRSLVNHGIDLTELPAGEAYEPTFLARNFTFSRIGHSFRITEMEAALLLPQLDTASKMLAARTHNAGRIMNILTEYDGHIHIPKTRPNSGNAWMVYPIVMRDESKLPIMRFLRQHGVEVRDLLPLTNQPCYRFKKFLYPVANFLNEHGFYIGCHQDLTDDAFVHLARVFEMWFDPSHTDLIKDVDFSREKA